VGGPGIYATVSSVKTRTNERPTSIESQKLGFPPETGDLVVLWVDM
jgi:hypothetical protein